MSNRTSPARIVLTGFSGTGKSAVGPLVAKQLGWGFVDTDDVVEKAAGKRILQIFADDGEMAFRDLESEALREVCSREKTVIATGGGAILRAENRRLLAESGVIVCLEVRPETIFRRLNERADTKPLDRPLLASGDPLERIRELKSARAHLYALCDWSVHTDGLAIEEVAAEVARAYEEHAAELFSAAGRVDAIATTQATVPPGTLHIVPKDGACVVRTSSRAYPVFTGWGNLGELGKRLREADLTRFAYVISDETVWHHLGDEVEKSLRSAEIDFDVYTVPPGERSKSLENASDIYDWLIEHRAERGHAVVAIGGGVVTDLGGYVAATFARGLPLVHVPTSTLGMVDAAIGGKVAVNHPHAKNMIGMFHQPRFVLEDVATLRTLPAREIKSGFAEAIKHGLIADADYLDFLERNAEAVLKIERDATVEAVRRSVAIKAEVVGEDEFETTGQRSTLNYGHTLAHAIESTTGYTRFRHGEADGIGMMAAASMAVRMGLLASEVMERQRRILERYGLPTHADGLDRERLLAAVALDKKVQGKKVRWILLEDVGRTVIRDDVPPEVVDAALDDVLR
jgi:3-dehydroquinate synthase